MNESTVTPPPHRPGARLHLEGLTVVLTTHHPQHALAVADAVLLMLSADRFMLGPAGDVLTEATLGALYGVPIRRVAFEHDGRKQTGLVPVFGRPISPDQAQGRPD